MSPGCDLDFEDSNNNKKSARHSGSWCCITIPNLVTKCSVIQKISSRQTVTDILNLRCDLDLKRSNPISPQGTLVYDAMLSNQVWLQTGQQFRRHNRNSHILTIEALTVTLTLKQWTNFFARHSGLWFCITTPGLVKKCSVVQKILSGQTFTDILNLCCDLDLESSNRVFPQDTATYNAVLLNQVWWQTDQQFRWYSKNSLIFIV